MKLTGRCYREYAEFPLIPFDPAIFGFTEDRSDQQHARQCPCFVANGGHVLWWNWPEPATREWCTPMSQFVITRGAPDDVDAEVVFHAEAYSDLVRHLLTTPYVTPRPLLEGAWPDEFAENLFEALAMGGFLRTPDSSILASTLRLSALGQSAGNAATAYLKAIESRVGFEALPLARKALARVASTVQAPPNEGH